MARPKRDPKTKEDILNRMLSYDFDGDIRHLGEEPAQITRTGPHTLRLTFPASGRVFDVSVHRPREFAQPRPQPATQREPEGRTFKQEPKPEQQAAAEGQPARKGRRKVIDRTVPPSQRRKQAREEARQ